MSLFTQKDIDSLESELQQAKMNLTRHLNCGRSLKSNDGIELIRLYERALSAYRKALALNNIT